MKHIASAHSGPALAPTAIVIAVAIFASACGGGGDGAASSPSPDTVVPGAPVTTSPPPPQVLSPGQVLPSLPDTVAALSPAANLCKHELPAIRGEDDGRFSAWSQATEVWGETPLLQALSPGAMSPELQLFDGRPRSELLGPISATSMTSGPGSTPAFTWAQVVQQTADPRFQVRSVPTGQSIAVSTDASPGGLVTWVDQVVEKEDGTLQLVVRQQSCADDRPRFRSNGRWLLSNRFFARKQGRPSSR